MTTLFLFACGVGLCTCIFPRQDALQALQGSAVEAVDSEHFFIAAVLIDRHGIGFAFSLPVYRMRSTIRSIGSSTELMESSMKRSSARLASISAPWRSSYSIRRRMDRSCRSPVPPVGLVPLLLRQQTMIVNKKSRIN